MKYLLSSCILFSTVFFLSIPELTGEESVNNGNATVVITRITKSGKPKGYLTSDAKIRLNNGPKKRFRMKPTMTFEAPAGMNTIYVNQNLTVGNSSITFDAKANETYTFNIYWRQESYWAGIYAGYAGQAIESSISGETVGGAFGIKLTNTSYNPPEEAPILSSVGKRIDPKDEIQDQESVESRLLKLKALYEKGLISTETYEKRQLEILQD